MKLWHVAAGVGGLIAVWYLWRSSNLAYNVVVPSSTVASGPAVEAKSGRGHFTGTKPLISAGPAVEAASGRGHF